MESATYPTTGLDLRQKAAVPVDNSNPMEERKEPTFVKFTDGEFVTGVLVRIEQIEIEKKQCVRYTVRDCDEELYSFIGTYQIDAKLKRSDIFHRVEIRCEGEDPTVTRNGNAMKKFKVLVSKDPVKGAPRVNPEITDEDIPF
jgi:hypothetical protein